MHANLEERSKILEMGVLILGLLIDITKRDWRFCEVIRIFKEIEQRLLGFCRVLI